MKRVVTGVNPDGRSHIVSVEELDPESAHKVWEYKPSEVKELIENIDPSITADWIASDEPGGSVWTYAPMPPMSESRPHREYPGIDEHGFHTTRTVDFDILVTGELTMVLDEDSIALGPGDCVIQQGTRHAWRNTADTPALLMSIIQRPVWV